MPGMPTGTVTFLFTDIEGSTDLLQRLGDTRYTEVLTAHHQLLRSAFGRRGGHEIDTQGDAFFVAFQHAHDAVAAAVAAQQAITRHAWPADTAVRVRMGLHTGTPTVSAGGYVGLDVHRAARICAAGHGGQILLSFETSRLIAHHPAPGVRLRDLGSHRLKDLQQPEKVFQVLHADLPSAFPPPKSLDTFANNLPRQLSSFVGREREIAEVKRLLGTASLLTLSGTGGTGKTRLALQVAADVLEGYPDGVWLVELAALSDPGLVPQTVAAALGVREVPGRPIIDTLFSYLQARRLLLVLDNCEHLVAACAQLAETILRSCRDVRILATSREALGIAGELAWLVPSLSLPDPRNPPPVEHLAQFESVRLFIERAAAANPQFALTPSNALPLTAVVHRLDGLPLAIELAAARVTVLSVEQIATRLDDRFRLLSRGSRTTLPRHQTLRAALDWSYQLLTPREQLLLNRLSVFAGGWTLERAEEVCSGAEIEGFDVLDLLTQLVFKSLVLMDEHNGEVRYRFLETVRQYGLERLEESGESGAIRRRHMDCFLALAERAKPELTGPDQGVWLDRLETEHDNLRGALEWCVRAGQAELGMRLAGALVRLWAVRGYVAEGRQRLASILAQDQAARATVARSEALLGAAILARRQGENAAARTLLEEALAIQRALGDQAGIAQTLNNLGLAARAEGEYAEARRLLEESLTLRRALGYQLGIASGLNNLGMVAYHQGDYALAQSMIEESLGIMRALGYRSGIAIVLDTLGLVATAQGAFDDARVLHEESLAIAKELRAKGGDMDIAYALNNLGIVAYYQGHLESARELLEESLTMRRASGDRLGLADTLIRLGRVVLNQGDGAGAAAFLKESLTIRHELGDKLGVAESLEGLAQSASREKQTARAVRLYAAAQALRESIGAPLPPCDRARYEDDTAAARTELEPGSFDELWASVRRLTVAEAVIEALTPMPGP